jgi:hypothetical protein
VRALQVLHRAARLYQKNHPHLLDSLEQADRALRETLEQMSPLVIRFERGAVVLGARQPGTLLPDSRGALKSLADELERRGVRTIALDRVTNIGELHSFAALVHALSQSGAVLPTESDWPALLRRNHISGIRVNAPLEERKASVALGSLISAVLQLDLTQWGQGEGTPVKTQASAPEELAATLQLLGKLAGALREKPSTPGRTALEEMLHTPQGTAAELKRLFSVSDRNTVSIVIGSLQGQAPVEAETLEEYLSRLAEGLILEFAQGCFRQERVQVEGLRDLLEQLAREVAATGELFPGALPPGMGSGGIRLLPGGVQWTEEGFAEYLYQRFWEFLPARDRSEVLRGRSAWCVPASSLRGYIEHLVHAGGEREARFALLNYAQCLERKEPHARRAVAAGLSEFAPVVESLWPTFLPEELSRSVLRALCLEGAPDVAAVLAGIVEQYARIALKKQDYAEVERILDALEAAPASAHTLTSAIRQRILNEQNWKTMLDAALANRPLDPVLPRLLGRDPTRLLDNITALLGGPRGVEMLPAMARLLRSVGDPVVNAMVTQLYDPRTPQALYAGAAVKLLAATRPERLMEALPSALSSWEWNVQDLAIAELVRLRPARLSSHLLLAIERAHPLVVPMMVDEIGISKEADAVPLLLNIASGGHPWLRDVYIRIKAVEGLGRMKVVAAADVLRNILRKRDGLMHVEPAGLRAAAEDALSLLENRPGSARVRVHTEATEKQSTNFQRPRRYLRIPLDDPLQARMAPAGGKPESEGTPAKVASISLGGAFLESNKRLNVGDAYTVQIKAGLRSIVSTAVVRNVSGNGGGVEFVHMKQDDREKLRRLIQRLTSE